MPSVEVALDRRILDAHPQSRITGFVARGLCACVQSIGGRQALADAKQALEAAGLSSENLSSDHRIRVWRNVFRGQGLKPSDYPSSAESLARRALRRGPPETGLATVDLYNAASIRFLAPIGGYDAAKLPASRIVLRFCDPSNDRFEPLGGRPEKMPIEEHVAVYACASTVLCWAFNHRDSSATNLDHSSQRGVFLAESLDTAQYEAAREAIGWLHEQLRDAGARVGPIVTVHEDQPVARLDG